MIRLLSTLAGSPWPPPWPAPAIRTRILLALAIITAMAVLWHVVLGAARRGHDLPAFLLLCALMVFAVTGALTGLATWWANTIGYTSLVLSVGHNVVSRRRQPGRHRRDRHLPAPPRANPSPPSPGSLPDA